eukprot:Nitzschia sp. Nitz4//scaffold34_size148208//106066//106976//NITZ4_002991-RA/size148208-augustus-gene-0.63-mRNA-1//1//CDS//3329548828//9358//frame0
MSTQMKHSFLFILLVVSGLVSTTDAYSFVPKLVSLSKIHTLQSAPACRTAPTMKVFDWKRRQANELDINDLDNYVLDETTLRPAPGSRHRKKRKGRGIAAGQGGSCGFGHGGQKSRSGRSVRVGFEGGQTPFYRRIPKWPGRPLGPGHKRKIYNLIKLDQLNDVAPGETCNYYSLFEANKVTKTKYDIHKVVVGPHEFTAKDIIVQANAFTKSAREAIEAAGGRCQVVKRFTNEILSETPLQASS